MLRFVRGLNGQERHMLLLTIASVTFLFLIISNIPILYNTGIVSVVAISVWILVDFITEGTFFETRYKERHLQL